MRQMLNGLVVILALTVAACSQTGTKQSASEYTSDSAITAKVKTALLNEPNVKGTAINVETYNGTVQLSGFVDSKDMADRAVATASNVSGVKSVKNDMRLKPQ